MLKAHMDACEEQLVAQSKIPANTGHTNHKGTPREAFIRGFLRSHLPENLAIGSGEVFDANSTPGQSRNQMDIVIHRKTYPKLDFGGEVSGFMIESVAATVEVKSVLTEVDIFQSVKAASVIKALTPNVVSSFRTGYLPPSVLNYVVAYGGPAKMETVYNWVNRAHENLAISTPRLPSDEGRRLSIPSPSIDAVFILGSGFLYFDNVPVGFGQSLRADHANSPDFNWLYCNTKSGNLLLFFCFLHAATQNMEAKWVNMGPYLRSFSIQQLSTGL